MADAVGHAAIDMQFWLIRKRWRIGEECTGHVRGLALFDVYGDVCVVCAGALALCTYLCLLTKLSSKFHDDVRFAVGFDELCWCALNSKEERLRILECMLVLSTLCCMLGGFLWCQNNLLYLCLSGSA